MDPRKFLIILLIDLLSLFKISSYRGNYQNTKIYEKGVQCTACPPEAKKCRKNLCSTCSSGSDCTCKLFCANCGEKKSDCTCSCKDGFTGHDCSKQCKDTDARCGKSPGWPAFTCQHQSFGATVRAKCPALCKLCSKYTVHYFFLSMFTTISCTQNNVTIATVKQIINYAKEKMSTLDVDYLEYSLTFLGAVLLNIILNYQCKPV